ncbi:hypothetical protein [Streptomyces sp. x-80]
MTSRVLLAIGAAVLCTSAAITAQEAPHAAPRSVDVAYGLADPAPQP